jgi:hypothetical protein
MRQLLTDFTFDTVETVVDQLRSAVPGHASALPLPYAW